MNELRDFILWAKKNGAVEVIYGDVRVRFHESTPEERIAAIQAKEYRDIEREMREMPEDERKKLKEELLYGSA